MSMVQHEDHEDVTLMEHTQVAVMVPSAAGAINKSEVEAQLDAAHKYRRNVRQFLNDAMTLATLNLEVAESCIYSLPRGGKTIAGPSVRLAEICASAYGNLHIGARVVGVEDKEIVAQGIAWDLEKNLRVTVESRRRITDKQGRRFNDDMLVMTGNAAASIGLRNAIFRVIPRAYVNAVYQRAREVAVGNASTLAAKRQTVFERLVKMGAMPDRILARVNRPSVDDITLDDLEILIGVGTAIKEGNQSVDDAFPPVEKVSADKGKSAIDRIVEQKKAADVKTAAPTPESTPEAKAETAKAAEPEPCSQSDFDRLEILATESGVRPKQWKSHITETMGFADWPLLTRNRLEEVRAWIRAHEAKK